MRTILKNLPEGLYFYEIITTFGAVKQGNGLKGKLFDCLIILV